MLFKMRSYFASFQIFLTRVFHEVKVNSLFSSVSPRLHNCSKAIPRCQEVFLFPPSSLLKKPGGGSQPVSLNEGVSDSAEAGLIDAFGFLPRNELKPLVDSEDH